MPNSSTDANAIAQNLLAIASREGERGVSWARLIAGLTVTLSWPIIHGEYLGQLVPRAVATFVLGILTVSWSGYVFLRLRSKPPTAALTYASIAIDAVLVNTLVLMYVIAPGESHQSIVEVHGCIFVYLAIVTAGVRLSPSAAYFGALLNSLFLVTLVAVNTVQVHDARLLGWAEWTTVAIGLIGSTILGVTIATRTVRLVLESAHETLKSEQARSKLGAYLSPEVAEEVLRETELRLGGKRQQVAVLFSDLRGFTRYAESLEPEQIVEQLNEYMSIMVDTIVAHQGVVDKFIGDGIMAVFGAPIPRSDDADRAIDCARAMMQAIEELNKSRARQNLSQLKQGIGIHFGPVVAGNVGSSQRAAYTVIGDTVNLASRLEQFSKNVEADVVVSQETLDACTRPHNLKRLGNTQVPGRDQSVAVFGI